MLELKVTDTFERWRSRLKDQRARALIAARLLRLSLGHEGDAKSISGRIRELRIHSGPGYRIYFERRKQMIVLLLCGGDKSTQTRDIEVAKQLAEEYE